MTAAARAFSTVAAILPISALAHGVLQTAQPPAASVQHRAPSEIVLGYDVRVEPLLSTIAVTAADKSDVTMGLAHKGDDERHLLVALKPIGPGTYAVTWRAMVIDGKTINGRFEFSVAP